MKAMNISLLFLALLCVTIRADFFTTGMNLVTGGNTPAGQEDLIKDQALPYLFDMLTSSKFKEFPFQGGKLTNVEVKIIPPKSFDQVHVDVFSDILFFQVRGLGAKIGADFEVIIKGRPANGHLDIDITDLGVDIKLKNQPGTGQGVRKVGSEIKLDLEHTHGDIKLSTEGSVEEIKNYLFGLVKEEAKKTILSNAESYIPSWGQGWGWKVGAGQPLNNIHSMMQQRTQDIVDSYYSENSGIITARSLEGSYKVGRPKVLANYHSVVASKLIPEETVKEKLIRNQDQCFFDDGDDNDSSKMILKNKLLSNAQHLQNHSKAKKLEYAVSPQMYGKFFVESRSNKPILNHEMVKQLLTQDHELPRKVEQYFGDRVVFNCQPSNKEPKLRVGDGDSIIGTYTVVCELNALNAQEPAYSMEMELEFTIHPDNKEDGNPVDRFGDFASMDMSMTPDGQSRITTRISDQPEPMIMFPGFADLFGQLYGGFN